MFSFFNLPDIDMLSIVNCNRFEFFTLNNVQNSTFICSNWSNDLSPVTLTKLSKIMYINFLRTMQ